MRFFNLLLLTFNIICSYAASLPNVKISGGNDAAINDFPYIVSVRVNETHRCGGTIISKKLILTCASCTNTVPVDLLSIRTNSTHSTSGGKSINISQVYQHEQYDPFKDQYNIAVLLLDQPLNFGKGVFDIPLTTKSTVIKNDEIVTILGWGATSKNGDYKDQLHFVKVATIDTITCKNEFFALLDEQKFCGGYQDDDMTGKGTCQFDEGGPVVKDGVLVGVINIGSVCDYMPTSQFIKIAYFFDYITNIINNNKQ